MKKPLTAILAVLLSASIANADSNFAPFPLLKDTAKYEVIGTDISAKLGGAFSPDSDSMIDEYQYGGDALINRFSPPPFVWPPVESSTQFSMCWVVSIPPGFKCVDTPTGPKIVSVIYFPPTPIIKNRWWDGLSVGGDYTQTWQY